MKVRSALILSAILVSAFLWLAPFERQRKIIAHEQGGTSDVFRAADSGLGELLGTPIYPDRKSSFGVARVGFVLKKSRGTEYVTCDAYVLRKDQLEKGKQIRVESFVKQPGSQRVVFATPN